MTNQEMNDVLAASLHVIFHQEDYSDEFVESAMLAHRVVTNNLFLLLNGDAEARSTPTCKVFAHWSKQSGPFMGFAYDVSQLSFHS